MHRGSEFNISVICFCVNISPKFALHRNFIFYEIRISQVLGVQKDMSATADL
jgi:hypothetical protein